jgi:chemotaxis protein CheX
VKVEYINPFISAAVEVFSTMLKCQIKRGKLSLSTGNQPTLDISGVVGLSGRASGTVVLSFSRDVATQATEVLLTQKCSTITSDVIDAVGELTNMIAGRAKSGLEHLAMTLALPTVVTGKNHIISFGSATRTIRIPFSCEWGEFTLEVGLVDEHEVAHAAAPAAREEVLVE